MLNQTYYTLLGCAEVVDGGDWHPISMWEVVGWPGWGWEAVFHGCGGAWAIIVATVDGGDIVLVVDGGGTWEGLIQGLTLVVGGEMHVIQGSWCSLGC